VRLIAVLLVAGMGATWQPRDEPRARAQEALHSLTGGSTARGGPGLKMGIFVLENGPGFK
jgi:hypothetical protein